MRADRLFNTAAIAFFVLFCSFNLFTSPSGAATKVPESPEEVITVKDYKWQSGGAGRAAIIKEITLQNNGKVTYKNIEIEADLYTTNDIPLGSLRSTIHDVLPNEGEKTFYNVNFGFMHSELEKTVLRVVGAEAVTLEAGSALPRDVIVVKNWEWTGAQYATEGILKEITLENKSRISYKDIKIELGYFGTSINPPTYTRAIIGDILPANSEKTFYGINVGFRLPGAKKTIIYVVDASRVPVKKLRPGLAKKGIPVGKPKKKVAETTRRVVSANIPSKETGGTAKTPQTKVAEGFKIKEGAPVPPTGVAPSPEEGGLSNLEEEDTYEEEPIPKDDIVVKDFRLGGGGITGTIGMLRELTLENVSGITYTNIHLIVDFYSASYPRPLGSNEFTINDVLPANSEKVFRDVKIGYLNSIPEKIVIRVRDATAMR